MLLIATCDNEARLTGTLCLENIRSTFVEHSFDRGAPTVSPVWLSFRKANFVNF